jgi:hypothetical protein
MTPINEKTNVALGSDTLIENFPLMSVVVPFLVPFSITSIPGEVELSSLKITVPVIVT